MRIDADERTSDLIELRLPWPPSVNSIWRNKGKEQDDKRSGEPDALLTCDKQRNGEWEGSFSFWFHKGAMQFVPTSDGRTMDLLRLGE